MEAEPTCQRLAELRTQQSLAQFYLAAPFWVLWTWAWMLGLTPLTFSIQHSVIVAGACIAANFWSTLNMRETVELLEWFYPQNPIRIPFSWSDRAFLTFAWTVLFAMQPSCLLLVAST